METACSFETSVSIYNTEQCPYPKHYNLRNCFCITSVTNLPKLYFLKIYMPLYNAIFVRNSTNSAEGCLRLRECQASTTTTRVLFPCLLHTTPNGIPTKSMKRSSSVGIVTGYGWTVRGSNPDGGEILHSRPALGPTQPAVRSVPNLFPDGKVAGRGVGHPPSSTAEVNESVELYIYSPSGPSWPV
jgi:hypothetical protein